MKKKTLALLTLFIGAAAPLAAQVNLIRAWSDSGLVRGDVVVSDPSNDRLANERTVLPSAAFGNNFIAIGRPYDATTGFGAPVIREYRYTNPQIVDKVDLILEIPGSDGHAVSMADGLPIDLNGDGLNDLITAGNTNPDLQVIGDELIVWLRSPNGFTRFPIDLGGELIEINSLAAGRVDKDNLPDVAISGTDSQGFAKVLLFKGVNYGTYLVQVQKIEQTDGALGGVARARCRFGRLDRAVVLER
jgi:hypothetical protein